jgi:hypothetical protein
MEIARWTLRTSLALPLVAAGVVTQQAGTWVQAAPALLRPAPDAVIVQNDADAGCAPHPIMGFGHRVDFEWAAVDRAVRYEIVFEREHSTAPVFHAVVDGTRATFTSCHTYVIDINLDRWQWRVRGLDAQGRGGPWSAPGPLRFGPCRQPDGRQCGGDPAPTMRLIRPGRPPAARLEVPALISPPEGTRFWHRRPRTTQLAWTEVPGAVAYDVFVDCYQCCRTGRWCSDVNGLDSTRHRVEMPTYTFDWYGAQPGRWRVRAVAPDAEGALSPWWTFDYRY